MADITGSDIVTVVFMMSLRSILNTMTGNGMSAAQAFTEANRILLEKSDYAELFISASAWMGILDIKTGDLSYVNAGYRNPVLIRSGGSELTDDRPELMICSKEDCVYKGGEFKLMPGDMVFLCSDGVLETVNAKGEYYGQERLFSCLDELTAKDLKDPNAECEAVCEGVSRDIAAYTEPGKKPGEIIIMCVKYAGVNE